VAYFTEGRKCTRVIYLEKVVKISSAPSVPSADDLNAERKQSSNRDDLADDKQTIEPEGIVCAKTTEEPDSANFAIDATDANDRNTPFSQIDLENLEGEYEC
jgi:hypothetical protein